MFLRESCAAEHHVVPVRIGIAYPVPTRRIIGTGRGRLRALAVQVVADVLHAPLRELGRVAVVELHGVKVGGVRIGIGHFGHVDGLRPTEVVVVVDADLAGFASFGRDQHHAESGTRTVDGGCGSIFQDGDAFDVLWVEGIHVARHAVNQNQGRGVRTGFRTVVDGTHTTDVDAHVLVQAAAIAAIAEVHARHQALQGLTDIADGTRAELFGSHGCHGACQIHLLLAAETHYHDFVQQLVVFLQDYVERFVRSGLHGLAHIAHVADADGGTGSRQTQHEVAVQVGDDAVARIGLHDRGADDGLAVGVHHAATHFHSLLLSFRRRNGGGENDFLAAHGVIDIRPRKKFVEDGEDVAAVGIDGYDTARSTWSSLKKKSNSDWASICARTSLTRCSLAWMRNKMFCA